MSDTTDFFDNLGGSGAPTALLKGVGDSVHGEIVDMSKRDYIPFGKDEAEADSNEPDGKRKQLVIILQTELRNWAGVNKVPVVDPKDKNSALKDPSEDDGKRAIYVPNRSNIQYAIGAAVREANAAFQVGGTLGVRIANLRDTGKGNPLKEHQAVYQAKQATAGDFFGGQQAPAAPPAQQAPAQQAPAQQAPAQQAPAQQAPATPAGDPWATPAHQAGPASGDPWGGGATTSAPPF